MSATRKLTGIVALTVVACAVAAWSGLAQAKGAGTPRAGAGRGIERAGGRPLDPGSTNQPHIHTLRNPSRTERAEVVITDIRDGDLRPTIAADPQPPACFS